MDGGKKSGGLDPRPDSLKPSSFAHRRRTDVAAPLLPALLPLDGEEKSGSPDRRTFFTTCNRQHRVCTTRSPHVLTRETNAFLAVSPSSEVRTAS